MGAIHIRIRSFLWLLVSMAMLGFSGCDKNDDDEDTPIGPFYYDYEQDTQGWLAGFADYSSVMDPGQFEFEFSRQSLPAEVGQNAMALRISGRNLSDDLFMFVKKKLTGLQPNHTYKATFRITLASSYPEQVGIGGSPGASVYLKAGGTTHEPMPIDLGGAGNNIRMNLDKGEQASSGSNMVVLGNIGIPGQQATYSLITRDNAQNPVSITADANGELWVIVGTDSGFEGTTQLYYNSIEVELE